MALTVLAPWGGAHREKRLRREALGGSRAAHSPPARPGHADFHSSLFEFGGPAARFLQPGYIRKGDVCVMNKAGKNNRHHYIVIDADSPTLITVEGNRSIPRQSIGHGRQDRKLIVAHYRLKVD